MLKFLIFLLVILFWLTTFPKVAFAQNLLNNPSLEDWVPCINGDPKNCYPNGWSKFGSIWWQEETYNKHGGDRSAKFSGINNEGNGGSGGIYQPVGVVPGATYAVSGYSYRFYSKSADWLGIRFGSGGISWYNIFPHDTMVWYRFTFQVVVPSGITTMEVYLKGEDNIYAGGDRTPNDVYFDDLSVDLISVKYNINMCIVIL